MKIPWSFIILNILLKPFIKTQVIPPTTIPTNGIGPVQLKIGLMFPQNESSLVAFSNSAAAATIAIEKLYKDKILPAGSNISVVWRYEECIESTSAGYAYELITVDQVDLLVAPPCIDAAIVAGHVATYYNIPVTLWGVTFATTLSDDEMYPTIMSVVPNYKDMARVTCDIMKHFNWQQFSFIYQADSDGGCTYFQKDFEDVINNRSDCIVSFKDIVDSWAPEDINYTITQMKSKSRIVVMCFDDQDQLRSFALALYDEGMYSDDYLYIIPDSDMSKSGLDVAPFWYDLFIPSDGRDADAAKVGKRVFQVSFELHIDAGENADEKLTAFSNELMTKMSQWPFYCADCNKGQGASPYSQFLHDAIYLYGLGLSNIFNITGSSSRAIYRNGSYLSDNSDVQFEGLTGNVVVGPDGVRDSIYSFSSYDTKDKLQPFVLLQVIDDLVNVTTLYDDALTTIWASRRGVQPLDIPICGFSGKECPMSTFEQYKPYFIAAIVIAIVLVLLIAGIMAYMVNMRLRDIEKQNQLWQVSFNNLVKMNAKKMVESMRSLQSGPSTTSTKFTFDSVHSSKHFSMYMFHQERVVGYKHNVRANLDKEEMAEFRQMRNIEHDNVNRFIGISLDGPDLMSIWRFCSRGSLRDVIANNTLNMDAFFVFSLMKDIVEGVYYLHNSFLQYHGYLKSSYCLVDDRWQVKLSNYGLTSFRKLEKRTARDNLWTAPELIRETDHIGSKEGDIYSLAIVCSEIVNMKAVWEPSETKGNPEEIVYLVKKGGVRPLRPLLQPAVLDLNPALLHLIRDCWADNPNDRPKIETVRSLMKSMVSGRTMNLMDHVFNMLEQYASSLEEEVEERTKELVEEKKKSDVLLYRMLPKQVAEKLKLGQSVEPETFECVTVFFSDIVSFTTLANRCTPLQVVNLLNDLYTVFDGIIAEYDVYKVETIGDGYLCVSGLPHRNGNEHGRHIANMSLAFMRSLDRYSIPHLPGEKISLRIGIHTGGVVTGVVGLAMPRYCLFGDTVNTASRMESNGKPNKIHISAETNRFLINAIGGFVTESRGEVIIKGKGVMETYWLVGSANDIHMPSIATGPPMKIGADKSPPMYENFKKSQS